MTLAMAGPGLDGLEIQGLLTGAPNPRWQHGSARERRVGSEGCLEADESEVGRNDKAEAERKQREICRFGETQAGQG